MYEGIFEASQSALVAGAAADAAAAAEEPAAGGGGAGSTQPKTAPERSAPATRATTKGRGVAELMALTGAVRAVLRAARGGIDLVRTEDALGAAGRRGGAYAARFISVPLQSNGCDSLL